MKEEKLHLYSIMPLMADHIDEICQDIKDQYEKGITTCALFSMTLVPEGNPVVNKAALLCETYRKFREKLHAMGVPNGVLVQASIGHGWTLGEMFPYQRYVGFRNGIATNTACPYDPGFRDYIRDALTTIASCHPDHIMIDDDFRLMFRPGGGCACPLHMNRFRELSGTQLSREELWDIVCEDSTHPQKDEYTRLMVQTQYESLVETARIMREGIDQIDPALPGSFCCCGNNAEFAAEIAAELAGKGNPIVVRINNGNYTPAGARYFSRVFLRAAHQIAKLRGKADVILAETDTCPQNRYSTGAMSLHTHFTGTILEGAKGAKHWITRLGAFEPQSGKYYRKILGKHRGFYEALSKLEPTLTWRGCRIPVSNVPNHSFTNTWAVATDGSDGWSACVLERLGLPFYFSHQAGGVVCMEGKKDTFYTDEEILNFLGGPVILASDTAKNLIDRGFGEYLGVDVRPWVGKTPTGEVLFVNGNTTNVQQKLQELVPTSEDTVVYSHVFNSVDKVHRDILFPGVTLYQNKLGGTVIVFAGTPVAEFNLTEAFAFLTWSRKLQLIDLLQKTGELPVYYPEDAEVYLRAADMPDGGLFCAFFNLGLDPIEEVTLVTEKPIKRAEQLLPDGSRKTVDFTLTDGVYRLDAPAGVLDPAIFFLY